MRYCGTAGFGCGAGLKRRCSCCGGGEYHAGWLSGGRSGCRGGEYRRGTGSGWGAETNLDDAGSGWGAAANLGAGSGWGAAATLGAGSSGAVDLY